jgi:hypothetical protein
MSGLCYYFCVFSFLQCGVEGYGEFEQDFYARGKMERCGGVGMVQTYCGMSWTSQGILDAAEQKRKSKQTTTQTTRFAGNVNTKTGTGGSIFLLPNDHKIWYDFPIRK